MKAILLSTILACGLFAQAPAPDAKVKILEARIVKLNARIAQLQKQMAVMQGALNAAQQDSASVVQQAEQVEAVALEEAGKAAGCPGKFDPETLICRK